MLERKNVERVLRNFGRKTQADTKRRARKHKASGRGQKSIRHELEVYETGNFSLSFYMAPHMEFQDKGVKGIKSGRSLEGYRYTNKMPPPSAFDRWSIRRGIAPRDQGGRFLGRKGVQFALARHIYERGVRPKRFFTDSFERNYKNLPDDIIEAYGLDIKEFMKSTLNTTTK